ncbi:hypothetical protein ACIQZN_34865 [Streptomyces sp. NPDC097595]|uniref:hypothetical protein n=1 Tax=Streptomyces sp. NPDC097595 TaxID=3366090 RepID=UPI00382040AF
MDVGAHLQGDVFDGAARVAQAHPVAAGVAQDGVDNSDTPRRRYIWLPARAYRTECVVGGVTVLSEW